MRISNLTYHISTTKTLLIGLHIWIFIILFLQELKPPGNNAMARE